MENCLKKIKTKHWKQHNVCEKQNMKKRLMAYTFLMLNMAMIDT